MWQSYVLFSCIHTAFLLLLLFLLVTLNIEEAVWTHSFLLMKKTYFFCCILWYVFIFLSHAAKWWVPCAWSFQLIIWMDVSVSAVTFVFWLALQTVEARPLPPSDVPSSYIGVRAFAHTREGSVGFTETALLSGTRSEPVAPRFVCDQLWR